MPWSFAGADGEMGAAPIMPVQTSAAIISLTDKILYMSTCAVHGCAGHGRLAELGTWATVGQAGEPLAGALSTLAPGSIVQPGPAEAG